MQVRLLGRAGYRETLAAMQSFTAARGAHTADELWMVEHPPVFTQGVAGRSEHLLDPRGIEVVQSDRGGQVTYHGPGQVVADALVDLGRLRLQVREYVFCLERSVLKTLEDVGVTGHRVRGAPGVYVRLDDPFGHALLGASACDRFDGLGKIAALGVKVSRHCTYHGAALNVCMDLAPYAGINPCGFAGLQTVDLATLGVASSWQDMAQLWSRHLSTQLSP